MEYTVTFKAVESKAITLEAENPDKAIKKAAKVWKSQTEPEFVSVQVKAKE